MNSIEQKIEQLEKELAKLKQEVVSRDNQQTTINSVEDAFNLLRPMWYIDSDGDTRFRTYEPVNFCFSKCNMTSSERAKQIKALIQLHLVAEAMNMEVEKEENKSFIICKDLYVFKLIGDFTFGNTLPTFNNHKLAEEALKKFKPLFKDLYLLND